MVGIARLVSDKRTFGYLCDVVIHPDHRRRGLGKQLVRAVVTDEQVQNLGTLLLMTPDAHGLYRQFGFQPIDNPELLMKR